MEKSNEVVFVKDFEGGRREGGSRVVVVEVVGTKLYFPLECFERFKQVFKNTREYLSWMFLGKVIFEDLQISPEAIIPLIFGELSLSFFVLELFLSSLIVLFLSFARLFKSIL